MTADSPADAAIRRVYTTLLATFGPQGWWPAPTPFEVAVGAVLTQNTAWRNVAHALERLRAGDLLSPDALLAAPPAMVAEAIRPSGYFNVKARRLRALVAWWQGAGGWQALATRGTGELRTQLLAVHGIGRETADDILLYAFDRPVFVVDAYTRRAFARLGLARGHEDYETLRKRVEVALKGETSAFNEFHALLVRLGGGHCRPRPRCDTCPLALLCPEAEAAGVMPTTRFGVR